MSVSSPVQQDVWPGPRAPPVVCADPALMSPANSVGARGALTSPFQELGVPCLSGRGWVQGLPRPGLRGAGISCHLPAFPACQAEAGKELVGVPQLLTVGSKRLLVGILEGAYAAQGFGQWGVPFKGTSGATCSAIPEWWL